MTTTPTDDRAEAAVLDRESLDHLDDRTSRDAGQPVPWWRPLRRWESHGRRVLPGVSFPVTVWVVWRAIHLLMTIAQNGRAVETAYNYDGEHYLRILHYGYWNPRPQMPSHAFFPGISWLATPVYKLTGSDAITVHVTITLTGLAAFICLWGAVKAWKDERIARRSVLLLALFPSSLFLWAFYSEGLFISLSAGAIWADRKGKHWVTTACFLAIGTTRSVGILIPAVVVLARIIRQRRIDRWAVAYAAAGVAGLAAVSLAVWRQVGEPLGWVGVQDDWGRTIDWPWVSVAQGFDNLYPDPETVMVPALVARNLDLWCIPIVLLAILYVGLSRRDRYPMEAWMLGAVMVAVPLATSVLASFNRFAMANWIIYPAYASFAERLPTWLRRVLAVVLLGLSVWTTWLMIGRFSVNRFVG